MRKMGSLLKASSAGLIHPLRGKGHALSLKIPLIGPSSGVGRRRAKGRPRSASRNAILRCCDEMNHHRHEFSVICRKPHLRIPGARLQRAALSVQRPLLLRLLGIKSGHRHQRCWRNSRNRSVTGGIRETTVSTATTTTSCSIMAKLTV